MNANWNRIFQMLKKHERLIIGLMSGTSMDGLDIALCQVSGSGVSTQLKVLKFATMNFSPEFKGQIKMICSKREVDLQMICLMNEEVGIQHAKLVLECINSWGFKPEDIDAIASHGQTIFHAPKSLHGIADYPNATLQIGDGDHIAVGTGILTISDFRQKHIAAGGEGAPLAIYGDYLFFSKQGEERVMLNIGGIANFTYLPGDLQAGKVFSTDVGPGNTLMDQYIQQHYDGKYYDEDGQIAASGQISDRLLNYLLEVPFLKMDFPKTTGPELFSLKYLESVMLESGTKNLKPEDVVATLCCFSAQVIIDALLRSFAAVSGIQVYLSGGGMHNPQLVNHLKTRLPHFQFHTTSVLGIDPDAKEAVLFALLANETLMGKPIDFGDRPGIPSVCMGKISLPD